MKENNRKPVRNTIIFTVVSVTIAFIIMAFIVEFTWRTFLLSVVGVLWGVSMLIMGLGCYYFFLRFRTPKCSAHAMAEYINYYPVNTEAPAEVYEFRFEVNGRMETAKTVVSEDLCADSPIGSIVDLWYDPDDPGICMQTKNPRDSGQLKLYRKLLIYGTAGFVVCALIIFFG